MYCPYLESTTCASAASGTTAEAAKATRLAAAGTMERATDRAAELLRLEKLRAELEARQNSKGKRKKG